MDAYMLLAKFRPIGRQIRPFPCSLRFSSTKLNQDEIKDRISKTIEKEIANPAVKRLEVEAKPENLGKPATLPMRFVDSLPQSWKPYAQLSRLDKPIGTWLLYSPCTWSITMAAYVTSAPFSSYAYMLAVFGVGALITRGAGCTINDMWDRNLDSQVARTMLRPLAAGAVTMPQAWTWLAAQCSMGLGILLSLPTSCWILGAVSMIPVFAYPAFKRFTYYPQAVLSFCFTWGALLGFPAMGVVDVPTQVTLWGSAFAWCMIYDTIYAHQDKLYDINAGIKSTALAWGDRTKPILQKLEVAQIGLVAASGLLIGMGPGFFAGVGVAAYRIWNMIKKVNLDDPENCWHWFLNNIRTGHFIWAGALIDYIARLCGWY